ncbi:MAG: hypothetical protein CM1200mP16_16870 [Nitrospina sp.]|nr:MAG: hypothetical protein CM1200mP16_16870 [Nitrospina sp.]
MNRQTLSVFSLFLVGVFSFVGVVGVEKFRPLHFMGNL